MSLKRQLRPPGGDNPNQPIGVPRREAGSDERLVNDRFCVGQVGSVVESSGPVLDLDTPRHHSWVVLVLTLGELALLLVYFRHIVCSKDFMVHN